MASVDDIAERQRLTRLWYNDYDEKNEYDYNPKWTDIIVVSVAVDEEKRTTRTTFKNKTRRRRWISSRKVYNLTDMI